MKKKHHSQSVYLAHILECIEKIEAISEGKLDRLHEEDISWQAVLRLLQVMAESTTHLHKETQALEEGIEWKLIRGFRNALVHDYLGDLAPEIIENVIRTKLPALKNAIVRIQRALPANAE